MAIDKSIRQYQQLVKPGKRRPGYAGELSGSELFLELYKKGKIDDLQIAMENADQYDAGEKTNYEKLTGFKPLDTYNKVSDPSASKDKKGREKLPKVQRGGKSPVSLVQKLNQLPVIAGTGNVNPYKTIGTGDVGPFKKGMETVLESPIKKASLLPQDKKSLRDPDRRNLMDRFADYFLASRIPGGRKTVERGINIATGKEKLSDIPSNYLASYQGKGPFQAALQAGRTFNLGKNLLGSGKGILSAAGKALPILGAGAGIAYLHKNRERFTGYATQKGYEDARDLRILETRRADMLQRKEEGRDYSDTNLGQVTREIAKKKGLDINNPNEMRNIDKDIEDIIKAPTDIVQFPGEDEIIQEQREQDRLQREVTRQAEENAARIAAEQAARPPPEQHGGGGGGDGGDHHHQETRSSSGWESSPFKKGGRIDKPLTGRSRDI